MKVPSIALRFDTQEDSQIFTLDNGGDVIGKNENNGSTFHYIENDGFYNYKTLYDTIITYIPKQQIFLDSADAIKLKEMLSWKLNKDFTGYEIRKRSNK